MEDANHSPSIVIPQGPIIDGDDLEITGTEFDPVKSSEEEEMAPKIDLVGLANVAPEKTKKRKVIAVEVEHAKPKVQGRVQDSSVEEVGGEESMECGIRSPLLQNNAHELRMTRIWRSIELEVAGLEEKLNASMVREGKCQDELAYLKVKSKKEKADLLAKISALEAKVEEEAFRCSQVKEKLDASDKEKANLLGKITAMEAKAKEEALQFLNQKMEMEIKLKNADMEISLLTNQLLQVKVQSDSVKHNEVSWSAKTPENEDEMAPKTDLVDLANMAPEKTKKRKVVAVEVGHAKAKVQGRVRESSVGEVGGAKSMNCGIPSPLRQNNAHVLRTTNILRTIELEVASLKEKLDVRESIHQDELAYLKVKYEKQKAYFLGKITALEAKFEEKTSQCSQVKEKLDASEKEKANVLDKITALEAMVEEASQFMNNKKGQLKEVGKKISHDPISHPSAADANDSSSDMVRMEMFNVKETIDMLWMEIINGTESQSQSVAIVEMTLE